MWHPAQSKPRAHSAASWQLRHFARKYATRSDGGRHGVRVVTGSTPQPVARGALAAALCKFFHVAIDLELAPLRGHNVSDEIGQQVARAIVCQLAACADDARLAGQMALGTYAIASLGRKFGGVHHLALAFDVQGTGTVAALAARYRSGQKPDRHRHSRALAPARLAGMAEEAGRLDRPAPAGYGIGGVAGRDVPGTGLRVPGDRRLEEESVAEVAKAAAGNTRADVVAELALVSPRRPWRAGPGPWHRCHSGLGKRRGGMIPESAREVTRRCSSPSA